MLVNFESTTWISPSGEVHEKADKRALNDLAQPNANGNLLNPTSALPRNRVTLSHAIVNDRTTFLPYLTTSSVPTNIATVTVTRQRETPLASVTATPTAVSDSIQASQTPDSQASNQGVLLQNNRGVAVGIAAGIFAGFAVVILTGIFIVKRRKRVFGPGELKSTFEH